MVTQTTTAPLEGPEGTETSPRSDSPALPVPKLSINGFRGIRSLDVPRLSQVTLIAGKNGVGKSTLLEAVRVFASRGAGEVLGDILSKRQEQFPTIDEDGDPIIELVLDSLFHSEGIERADEITISTSPGSDPLRITMATPEEIEADDVERYFEQDPPSNAIKVSFGGLRRFVFGRSGMQQSLPRRRQPHERGFPEVIPTKSFGPDVMRDHEIAPMWDEIALTDDRDDVIDSLAEMYGKQVLDLAITGGETMRRNRGRRAMVRLKGRSRPVPLKSLGDGATRIVGLLTAASLPSTSLVLVDEIENGIHHTIQDQFWGAMIFAAQLSATQIIATTQSWDCVRGFASGASEGDYQGDCSLIRLDEIDGALSPVTYTSKDLRLATEFGTEVR